MSSFWNSLQDFGSVLVNDLQEISTTVSTDVNEFIQGGTAVESENDNLETSNNSKPKVLLRYEVETFTTDPLDTESFQRWLQSFTIQQHRSVVDELLSDSRAYEHYTTLVPISCSTEEFWSRYIYKLQVESGKRPEDQEEEGEEEKRLPTLATPVVPATPTPATPAVPATPISVLPAVPTTSPPSPTAPPTMSVAEATVVQQEPTTSPPSPTTPSTMSVVGERSPSPKAIPTKMDLPKSVSSSSMHSSENTKQEDIAEDWELWE